ncbi:MAG TPA: D-2-hydroxyacid dehydrogenase [Candidatus Limnocylindria bacterium]|nr:D-2-hydroxyacid dehydrogenase [Candidatus Limnocylindria bacterium]
MDNLRIYVDLAMPPDALELLRAGTTRHELVFPAKPITSVLAKGERDPQFTTVDVAFGQPDLGAVADSERLRWMHISSAGITRYDTPEFRALVKTRGIAVSNSSEVYNEACAAHVLSFMLAQARLLPLGLRTRAANGSAAWQAIRGGSGTLRDETVLLVGYGAIARRLAELLAPFDVKIVAHRRAARGDETVPVVTADGLATTLAAADHVVNILPESAETRGFFDQARFAGMKPGAVFYNIGRGATVDQEALLGTLRSGRLGAAWLDVTEPEPLPDGHPLWAEPNCFITPHVAGGHTGEAKTLVRHFLKNLERFVRHEPLADRVM